MMHPRVHVSLFKFVLCTFIVFVLFSRFFPASAQTLPAPQLSIWCEFMPYKEVAATLPILARYHCDLLLHVGRSDVGSPDLVALCRAARSNGRMVSPPVR